MPRLASRERLRSDCSQSATTKGKSTFTRFLVLAAALLVLPLLPTVAAAQTAPLESDQLPLGYTATVRHAAGLVGPVSAGGAVGRDASGGVLGVDSVVNFQGSFYDPGIAF